MIYEHYLKNSSSVNIENVDNTDPYTSIGNKAFLSCKNVYEITLPNTIREIGDWAFAHMKDLKSITVPANKITVGRDAFLDCNNLNEIIVYPNASENDGLSFLLASCVTILKSYNLLDFEMSVKNNEEWCKLYDSELIHFINSSDDSGFQPFIVGWFNDEGEEEQLDKYIETTRANKATLCFLRLKYNSHITDGFRSELITYIRKQFENVYTYGRAAWTIFRDKLSDDIEYVKIAVSNNLLSSELKSELIKYLNNRNASPEIVAYLLSLNEKVESIENLFEL